MTFPHNETDKTPLSPRELLTGELPAVLSLWEYAPTPATAQTVLALWAGVQRLRVNGPDPDEDRLKSLVRVDAARLARLACEDSLFDADDWLRRAEDLDRAWDAGEEDFSELDWQAHELVERLDRAALTVWAIDRLAATEVDGERLTAARGALGQAEEFLAARVDLFLCLGTDVAAVLSNARPGLEEDRPDLWETLLLHRRIEEARDRIETPPDRTRLFSGVPRSAPTARALPLWPDLPTVDDRSPILMQAAGAGPPAEALLHRLASQTPAEAATKDAGQAWAHFLAATVLDTGIQEAWRRAFLSLEMPPTEVWSRRRDAALRLEGQHDWLRRHRGEGVFTLEPRRLDHWAGLLELLEELVQRREFHGRAPDWSWLPEPQLMMAADVPRPAGVRHRYWREPGGSHSATLVTDLTDATTPLRINFRRGEDAAEDLAGRLVWLAGCRSVIDAAGNADFEQGELRRAREEGRLVTLLVGEDRTVWEPVEHHAA